MQKINHSVIIKTLPQDVPRRYELTAAKILADHFRTDVVFLRPTPMKSPDLEISGKIWELKSPIGNSKNTMHNNFKEARRKTKNIVIDLRRCKMNEVNALARIRTEIKKRKHRHGEILVINKRGKVLDLSGSFRYNCSNRY